MANVLNILKSTDFFCGIKTRTLEDLANVLSILKSNDFFCGFKIRTLEDLGEKGNVNFKEQIRILIRSIEDPQQRLECYDYWEQEKGKASL